jgi:hypothetical protein
VPFLVLWGIWLARNASLFEDIQLPTFKVSSQVMGLLPFYKEIPKKKVTRGLGEFQVDKSVPWGHFDGACQGQNRVVGLGFTFFLSESHYFLFKANLGSGTNNIGELMALFYMLKFALERDMRTLQVFGDSLLVIN